MASQKRGRNRETNIIAGREYDNLRPDLMVSAKLPQIEMPFQPQKWAAIFCETELIFRISKQRAFFSRFNHFHRG
jgi:hypothetical protein